MKKLSYLIGLAAISLSACATTDPSNSGALSSQRMSIKPSTSGLNKQRTIQITNAVATLTTNPFVLDIVNVDKSISFKSLNHAFGVLGPKVDYEILDSSRLQKFTVKDNSKDVYCKFDGNSHYAPCLIDENKDGSFTKRALSVNGALLEEQDIEEPLSYRKGNGEISCNLNIIFSRTLLNNYRISAVVDDSADCPRVDRISNHGTVTVKKEELPKEYSILGSTILIHSFDKNAVSYTVKRPISSGLSLSTYRSF